MLLDIRYTKCQNSVAMDKNSRDPVHCWLVWGKAFHAAAKYLYAGLEETGIDDTDFRILEVLLNKGPLPVNTIGPKVHLTPGSISTAVDRLVERGLVSRVESPEDRQFRSSDVPVRTAFLQHSTQVLPKLFDGRSAKKPVAVIDLAYNETRFEDDNMRNHRIVLGVRVFGDVEILLNLSCRIG